MVKKRSSAAGKASASARKRRRRSDEQIIADLQRKIREVKDRATAKQLKESPGVKSAVAAVRAIDRALDIAADETDTPLRHALADARKPLAKHLASLGLKLPRARLPKGPRPRSGARS